MDDGPKIGLKANPLFFGPVGRKLRKHSYPISSFYPWDLGESGTTILLARWDELKFGLKPKLIGHCWANGKLPIIAPRNYIGLKCPF